MAIAYGASGTVHTTSSFTSIAVSGTNTLGIVSVFGDSSADNITAVTWGGNSMTKIGAVKCPTDRWFSMWYIANPTSSSSIAFTGGSIWRSVESYYTGVEQTTPLDVYNTNTVTSTAAISVTATISSSNCWAIMGGKENNGGLTYTPSGILTSNILSGDAGGLFVGHSNGTVSTGSQTATMTASAAWNQAALLFVFKAATTDVSDTFFPDPNPETTSVDGRVWHDNFPTQYTWAQVHDNAGTGGSDTETSGSAPGLNRAAADNNSYNRAQRGIFAFDTSSIPDTDTIDSATLSLYCSSVDNGYGGFSTNLTSVTTSANTSLTSTDYNIANYGSTNLSDTSKSLASGWTTSAYNSYTLNASGITNISLTGISKFAHRITDDIAYNTPTTTGSGAAATTIAFADTSGTTNDPKLVVVHSAAAASNNNNLLLLGTG